jgi:hypothetical protein
MVRDAAGTLPLWIFVIWLATAQSVSAQGASSERPSQGDCSAEGVKGFELFRGPAPQIRTKFLVKPDVGARGAEIRSSFIYSQILLFFAVEELFKSSLRQCPLDWGRVDTESLELKFSLSRIGYVGANSERKCSLNRCADALSELLQSAAIDRLRFRDLTETIAEKARRNGSVDLKNPSLAALLAAEEAFRHIYPPGSRERLLLDVSGSGYESANFYNSANFEEFAAWLTIQQDALRRLSGTASPTAATPSASSADDDCAPSAHVDVEGLKIDHHAWGHRSIILIKNVYTNRAGEFGRFETAALRALCGPTGSGPRELGDFPWSEMASRIQCTYGQVNRDDWTVLYAKQNPPSVAEMPRYAQSVAKALEGDKCTHSGARVLLVDFLQQQ